MDKYKKLAPRDKYRYKPQKNTCCHSRVGMAKKLYESAAEASSTGLVPYECRVHKGKWHAKTKRT